MTVCATPLPVFPMFPVAQSEGEGWGLVVLRAAPKDHFAPVDEAYGALAMPLPGQRAGSARLTPSEARVTIYPGVRKHFSIPGRAR
jgi:hypothetical protein